MIALNEIMLVEQVFLICSVIYADSIVDADVDVVTASSSL